MQDTSTSEIKDWNLPIPLEKIPQVPWPTDTFPSPFDVFSKELSRSTETPIELSTMLTLAVVATSAHTKYIVQIKEDYIEPMNIWPVVILPPATRKTRVYSVITGPLKEWEFEQKEILSPKIQSTISRMKTIEGQIKELRSQAAKATEEKYSTIQNKIEDLESEIKEVPSIPQLWTADVTPEHLGTIMAANNDAMAILSDEGGIFDILSGLYSDGRANIDLFLQAHAAGSVRVDRGSRTPIFMERAVLTMGLTIQPQVIRNMCNNKTFRGRGLLGRFLYVLPASNIGFRTFDEPPMNRKSQEDFQLALRKILEHPLATTDTTKTQHKITLCSKAYTKWQDYAKSLEIMMRDEVGHLSHITDWAGKLPGAIARIAGLLHVMRHAAEKPWEYQITFEDMSAAVKIGHCLTNHALRVFDLIQESDGMQLAKDICSWIKQDKLSSFSLREANRKIRRFKKDNRASALDILTEHEIIREKKPYFENKSGRKSEVYEVNPHFIKE